MAVSISTANKEGTQAKKHHAPHFSTYWFWTLPILAILRFPELPGLTKQA
jgi:hypothetical protein